MNSEKKDIGVIERYKKEGRKITGEVRLFDKLMRDDCKAMVKACMTLVHCNEADDTILPIATPCHPSLNYHVKEDISAFSCEPGLDYFIEACESVGLNCDEFITSFTTYYRRENSNISGKSINNKSQSI